MVCDSSHATCDSSHVTCDSSHVTCDSSHVTGKHVLQQCLMYTERLYMDIHSTITVTEAQGTRKCK